MEQTKLPLLYQAIDENDLPLLMTLKLHPGFKILEKLFEAECNRATQDVIKLNPLDSEYHRKLAYLQQRSRVMNEFCTDILKSIEHHMLVLRTKTEELTESEYNNE